MKRLKPFSIPIKGLKSGIHQYDFIIDDKFFQHFEGSLIEKAQFKAQITLEKRIGLLLFDFDFEGFVDAECDRCLAPIQLPIEDNQRLIVKYGEQQSEDPEVVFITEESNEFNVAPYLYEFISLALPFNKVYDCENDEPLPCNFDMLKYIEQNAGRESHNKQIEDEEKPNSIWDVLKDFDKN